MIQTIRESAKYFSLDYRKAVQIILSHSSVEHRTKVKYALFCASDEAVENSYDRDKFPDVYSLRQQCLKLVEQWLENNTLVTEKQLRDAANTAADAAAAYAAYAAVKSNALKKKHYQYLIQLVLGGVAGADSWLIDYVMKSVEMS